MLFNLSTIWAISMFFAYFPSFAPTKKKQSLAPALRQEIISDTLKKTPPKPDSVLIESQAGGDESRLPTHALRENPMLARRDSVVNFARTFLGRPYIYGGTTPYGFDCSGFAWYVFNNFGYKIPRVPSDQATLGRWVKETEAEPGDLVFYGYPYGAGHVYTHTAIVYARDSNNNVSVIHSSFLGLAITVLHFDPSYTCRLIGIKRVIE